MASTSLMHETASSGPDGVVGDVLPGGTVDQALAWAHECGSQEPGRSGESHHDHARATIGILQELGADEATRTAMALVDSAQCLGLREIENRFGAEVARLVDGMLQIQRLRELHAQAGEGQTGTLRKMLLAMATDIRVVVLRLASRLRTLRYHAAQRTSPDTVVARETLDVLAPLANRLGLWQLKWELEDLSFRFLEPQAYRKLARELEQRRAEREAFVERARAQLQQAFAAAGIQAEISGRPKHIYSIHEKMRRKERTLEEISDLHALRAIVANVTQCYAALDIIHGLWTQVPEEYDDYIARPKPNGYQSLHTVVVADGGRLLEVQIRSREMHRHAEYGVASHWRYKERGNSTPDPQVGEDTDAERVTWMRQLLAWQSELGQSLEAHQARADTASRRIYVLTPQARVIELPAGSTPVDFAYHVHTKLGHRCRGARVDGQLVPLNTPLRNAQTVEIIAAREGSGQDGPSRDWLNAQLGYVASPRARAKVRQWFNALEHERDAGVGRERIERVLQREGRTALSLDELARRLGFDNPVALFVAVAHEEVGARQIEEAIRPAARVPAGASAAAGAAGAAPAAEFPVRPAHTGAGTEDAVLVVGIDSLMTQLARCCRPVPPDPIAGFVTKGRGVSVHRETCPSYLRLAMQAPERVIEAAWSDAALHGARDTRTLRFPVEVEIRLTERPTLLRDITDVLARERVNVLAMQTLARRRLTSIRATLEVRDLVHLQRTLALVRDVKGVVSAGRR